MKTLENAALAALLPVVIVGSLVMVVATAPLLLLVKLGRPLPHNGGGMTIKMWAQRVRLGQVNPEGPYRDSVLDEWPVKRFLDWMGVE